MPNPAYLKKKTADAEKAKKQAAAASGASGDDAGGDDKDNAAQSDEKSEDEGTEEKQLARLHFFRSKVHTKDVNRLVVASFVSRYVTYHRRACHTLESLVALLLPLLAVLF